MSPHEEIITIGELIDEVEVSIIDSLGSLTDDDAARLYAEVLNAEQRLDALSDALALLSSGRS